MEPCIFPQLNKQYTSTTTSAVINSFAHLSEEQTTQVHEFCKQKRVELSAVLQLAWALILRRYVGLESVVFGFGTSGLVCGNMFDETGEDTIEKHLIRVSNEGSNEDISRATSWITTGGLLQSSFNSFVILKNESNTETREKELQKTEDSVIVTFTNTNDGKLMLAIKHESRLLDETHGRRLAETTRLSLLKIIADSSLAVGQLDLITEYDLAQIWAWNKTVPQETRICAHQIFERQARSTRSSPAILSWDGSMDYAELDKASSNLGAYLSNRGIGPDMVVPICFEKSRWAIVAMMGALKAGAAFTTMDAAQPTNRLEDTIMETKSNVVLASSSQGGRFEQEGRQVIMDIPYICEKSDLPSYTADSLNVRPENLAYVAFTSGSTGRPKGVAHTHVSACASITLKNPNGRESGYGPGSRILQFASQAFAASVVEILKTLGSGGCLCIPSDNVRLNNITQFMRENGITRAFFTPSLLKLFTVNDLDFLKILLVGGEAVLPELIQTWASQVRLIEAIGMTEGVAITTEIEPGSQVKRINQTSSGLPWIVDVNDINKLVPIGAIGELLVEGPCLAKEYLGDPEKTDTSFVVAPSWANRYKDPSRIFRLYRTGDLARYFNDGVVRILGRKDNRVKLNGQRIELGDVEHHLEKALPPSMPIIADVLSPNDSRSNAFLVAFIFSTTELGKPSDPIEVVFSDTIRDEIALLVPQIKKHVAQALPAYMVPTVFLPLSRRPTNMSGKVDRKRLRSLAAAMSTTELLSFGETYRQMIRPSTDMEKTVFKLWVAVLNIDPKSLGLESNFFMHGGDSLRAMKLVKLARENNVVLTIGNILQNPVLGDMSKVALAVENGNAFQDEVVVEDSTSANDIDINELRHLVGGYEIQQAGQATDWQAWAVTTGLLKTRGWTDYLTFDFNTSLDIDRLQGACEKLLQHFPVLKSVFVVHRRRCFQVELKDYPLQFKIYDVAATSSISKIAAQIYSEDASTPVGLGEPIVRFMLLREQSGNNRLLIRISHAQYDAMSLPVFFKALNKAYTGKTLGGSPSFFKFVQSSCHNRQQSEAFWKELLNESQMTKILPLDSPTYNNVVNKSLLRTVPLPTLQAQGITTATAVLAAWSLVLAKLSGSNDIVFGSLTSGRHVDIVHAHDIFGPCMNINPVRAKVNLDLTMLDFLKQVQATQIACIPHENVGFRRVIEDCTQWPSWHRFSSIVNHVHIEDGLDALFDLGDNLIFDFGIYEPMHDKSDLWLQTLPKKDELDIELRYSKSAVSDGLAESVLLLFATFLKQTSSSSDATLSHLLGSSSNSFKVPIASTSTAWPGMIETTVKSAWAQVLFKSDEDFENAKVGVSTPFYNIWGDLVAAAALCQIYRGNGFDVSVEDIIDNATIAVQIRLLHRKLY